MSVLQVEQITKCFGSLTALDAVSLEVSPGEVFGFIGPNGAGKTTLIRVLLGIYQATQGRATIFGLDAWHDAVELHRRLAYVPGDVNLWPNLTGGEVIDLLVRLRHSAAPARRAELIERFDLDPSKKCRTYSKGNRQKVALIAAFACEADLYLLDEPTSGLDPLMEGVFLDYVTQVKDQGKSVFLSSHILSEVEKLCDRVAIIRQGKIVESGALSDLRHLMRTRLSVQTARPADGLTNHPNVHDLTTADGRMEFSVDTGALDEIVSQLAEAGVLVLEAAPPSLEDIFLRHYERADDE